MQISHQLEFAASSLSMPCNCHLKWFICVEHNYSFSFLNFFFHPWTSNFNVCVSDLGSRVTIASRQVLVKLFSLTVWICAGWDGAGEPCWRGASPASRNSSGASSTCCLAFPCLMLKYVHLMTSLHCRGFSLSRGKIYPTPFFKFVQLFFPLVLRSFFNFLFVFILVFLKKQQRILCIQQQS